MIRWITYVICFLMVTGLVAPVAGDVFIWTDSEGVRHFSNISPPENTNPPKFWMSRFKAGFLPTGSSG